MSRIRNIEDVFVKKWSNGTVIEGIYDVDKCTSGIYDVDKCTSGLVSLSGNSESLAPIAASFIGGDEVVDNALVYSLVLSNIDGSIYKEGRFSNGSFL